jgi:hypothetical protein
MEMRLRCKALWDMSLRLGGSGPHAANPYSVRAYDESGLNDFGQI